MSTTVLITQTCQFGCVCLIDSVRLVKSCLQILSSQGLAGLLHRQDITEKVQEIIFL